MSSKYRLEVEGMDLAPGESVRMGCPFCLGEGKTFSLTKTEDGALLYNCYRANCTAKGVLGHSTALLSADRRRPRIVSPFDFEEYQSELTRLDEQARIVGVASFWHMPVDTWAKMGVMWHGFSSRLSLPIYGPDMSKRGYVQRIPPWSLSTKYPKTPKALTRLMNLSDPTLGWGPSYALRGTVTVVEDIPSAFRLADAGIRAVALCGTHVSSDAAIELASNTDSIRWALDKDATRKAVEHCRDFRYMFRHSSVALLPKDVKDMTRQEVDEWVSSLS